MPGIFDAQKLSVLHDVPLQGAFVSPTAIETVQYQIARRADMYLPVGVPELVSLKALNYQTRVQEVLGYTGLSTWLMRAFSPVECYHSPKGISPQDTSAIIPLLVIDPSLITDSLAILLSQKSDENIDRAALRFKKLNESERTTLKIELIPALRELLMYLVPIDGEWAHNGRISYIWPGHRLTGMIMIFQDKRIKFQLDWILDFSSHGTLPKTKWVLTDVRVTPLIFGDALSAVRSGEHAKSSIGETFHFIEKLREQITIACLEWGTMKKDEQKTLFRSIESQVLARKDLYFTSIRHRLAATKNQSPNSEAQLAILHGLDWILKQSVIQLMGKWRYLWARSARLRYDIERQSSILFELIERQLSIYARVGITLNSLEPKYLQQKQVHDLLGDTKMACQTLWCWIRDLLESPYIHRIRGLRPFVDDVTQLEISYQKGVQSPKAVDYIRELLKSLLLLKGLAYRMADMRAEDFARSGSADSQKRAEILRELEKVASMLENKVFLPQVTITGKTAEEFESMLVQTHNHIAKLS